MSEQASSTFSARALGTRWLGVGLATLVAVVTLGLGLTGRLSLYISPESAWFACVAAVVTLAIAIWSCTLPLGAEDAHGHDHGPASPAGPDADLGADAGAERARASRGRVSRRGVAVVGAVAAGVVASGVVGAALVLPPASLSVQLAMSRVGENTALFAGVDSVALGAADTSTFGVGDWASVFATATDTTTYDGTEVVLTGFVTPGAPDDEGIDLTRLIITHCVIDAQTATLPVVVDPGEYRTGQWVEITGTVRADDAGDLRIEPTAVVAVDEPEDPYEY